MTSRRLNAAVFDSAQVDVFHGYVESKVYMVVAVYGNVQDKIFLKSVFKTVAERMKWLCANVFNLDDLSLCSFVDYVSDERNFKISRNQLTEDVTGIGIIDQKKGRVGFLLNESVTLLMELERESDTFNASIEMNRRAC